MNIQDILSVFNANHEFIDSVINPQVNDGNRTAFAACLQRMVSTPFHDNEPSANCNENQAVERRIDRTFAENSVHALSTGGDAPQGMVPRPKWRNYSWHSRCLNAQLWGENAPIKNMLSAPEAGAGRRNILACRRHAPIKEVLSPS